VTCPVRRNQLDRLSAQTIDSAATLVLIGSEAKTLSKPAREVWGLSHRFLFGERLSSEINMVRPIKEPVRFLSGPF
jgi:hypothetical protein